jgi:dolichol kinase
MLGIGDSAVRYLFLLLFLHSLMPCGSSVQASVVGRLFGRVKWCRSRKTIEGTLAAIVGILFVVVVPLLVVGWTFPSFSSLSSSSSASSSSPVTIEDSPLLRVYFQLYSQQYCSGLSSHFVSSSVCMAPSLLSDPSFSSVLHLIPLPFVLATVATCLLEAFTSEIDNLYLPLFYYSSVMLL